MTKEEIMALTAEQIEERKASLIEETKTADEAGLDAINEELTAIEERSQQIALETRKADMAAVISGAGSVIASAPKEVKKVKTLEEIRSSKEYMDAYRDYIIKEDDRECRALLTELSTTQGTNLAVVPVPKIIDGMIRTAWEKDDILSRVKKTYVKGVLRVPYEYFGTPAAIHEEGANAPQEESLILGIVEMVPSMIKKWIGISDESIAVGMGDSEAFLRYIYDELTYRITQYLAETVVGTILDLKAAPSPFSSNPQIYAEYINTQASLTAIPTAFSHLSDAATDPVIIMNKLTYAKFIEAQAAANFSYDPFMGLPVLFSSVMPVYDPSVNPPTTYAIVGDLSGVQINFPEGDDVIIKYDDLSLAEYDMVKIVGRLYAAVAVTAPGRFVNIQYGAGGE